MGFLKKKLDDIDIWRKERDEKALKVKHEEPPTEFQRGYLARIGKNREDAHELVRETIQNYIMGYSEKWEDNGGIQYPRPAVIKMRLDAIDEKLDLIMEYIKKETGG